MAWTTGAYRKGNNYGTIVCDHESHRPIDIFAERTSDAFEKWLTAHPDIFLATRDRSNSYAKALDKVCPKAIQVADRFHLSKNLLDELKEFGKQIFPSQVRMIDQSKEQENKNVIELPKQEEVKSQESDKKKKIVRRVKQLCKTGMTIKKIAKEMKLAKGTVRRYINLGEESASSRKRTKCHRSGYYQYENDLIDLVGQKKNAVDILKTLREKGLPAGKSTVFRWVAQLKGQGNIAKCGGIFHIPTAQDIAKMIEKDYMVFLATEASGGKENFIGYLSSCIDTRNFEEDWCLEYAESAKNAEEELWYENFFKALEASKVAGTYDTIVAEQFRNKGVLWLLNYHLFCALQREHFTHAVFEIYEIIKAEKEKQSSPLYLPNVSSLTALLKMGVKPIGIVNRPAYTIGDWKVWVKANLYAIEVEEAFCFLSQKVKYLEA